jgi:fibronectin type 3 domain-containing protein
VTLKNNGNSGLTVSGITVSDTDFTTSGSVVGVTLAVGQSATLNVIFAPKTVAANTATVKVSSNAANSPATINVTGKGVSGTAHSVALTWGASGSTGVTGYYLYRSNSSSSGYVRLTASPLSGLQYTDGTVQSSTTYYYEVSAVNSSGIESTRSAPVTAAIP